MGLTQFVLSLFVWLALNHFPSFCMLLKMFLDIFLGVEISHGFGLIGIQDEAGLNLR